MSAYGQQLAMLPDPIDVAFAEFYQTNPQVYTDLVALCRRWRTAGNRKIGMKALFEVLRWERGLTGAYTATDGFRLNNNYTSRYARLIMANERDLVDMFETRTLHPVGGDDE